MEPLCIGNIVQVKTEFIDELSECDLKGAKGIVRLIFDPETEDDDTTVLLEWTAETLCTLPDGYFLQSFEQEVSWTNYYIPLEALEKIDEKADELAMQWQKQDVFTRLFLSNLGREGRLIAKAFETPVDPAKVSPMQNWFSFLENMTWPNKGRVCYPYEEGDGPLVENDKLLVCGLNGIDLNLGIMVDVEFKDKSMIIPLQDIMSADLSKNGRYLDAYGLWMACIG